MFDEPPSTALMVLLYAAALAVVLLVPSPF
jgi:hypothetical protein